MVSVSNCLQCREEFIAAAKHKQYCSEYCYQRNYYLNHKDKYVKYAKKHYLKHKEKYNKQSREWHQKNKTRMNEFGRKHRRKRKVEILEHYGGVQCFICGVDDIEVLTLDHVAGGGTKQRRKFKDGHATYRWIINNNYPDGFRVLCRNCNWKEYLKSLRGK